MIRKYGAFWLACLLVLSGLFSFASAETLGFGYVNAADVAIRRGVGGKVIGRLPADTCVWIRDSRTDSKGVLWYEVNAGLNVDYTNLDYTGWMKAEFIDAGQALWHDVKDVEAGSSGIVALRTDGTVQAAGGWAISRDGLSRVSRRRWLEGVGGIRQGGVCDLGMVHFAVGQDGTWYSTDYPGEMDREKIRLAGGRYWLFALTEDSRLLRGQGDFEWVFPLQGGDGLLSRVTAITDSFCRVLFLTDEGTLLVAEHMTDPFNAPEPDWAEWTDLAYVHGSAANFSGERGQYYSVYVGIRRDGTVLAEPEALRDQIAGWHDMRKILVAGTWVLGLKQDGTVVTAGVGEMPDVSGWAGITDIAVGVDFCTGLKADGTLVFAGDHVFMGEGHNRR